MGTGGNERPLRRGRGGVGLLARRVGVEVCLAVVVLTGWSGQISLAQMAFGGVAGFSLSRLATGAGVPFPVAPLLAAALAAVGGLLVGLPALRARGVSLAVVTLAGAVVVEEVVFKNPALTGGFGGARVPAPSMVGWRLAPSGPAVALLGLPVLGGAAGGPGRGPGARTERGEDLRVHWSPKPGLNWGPTHYECVALPTELFGRAVLVLRSYTDV